MRIDTSLTPGVYTSETDQSFFPNSPSTCAVGMVGTADKGPVNEPVLITSPTQFIRTFGEPIASSYGTYAAIEYLRNGNQLWYNRIGNAAINLAEPALALATVTLSGVGAEGGISIHARTPGAWGNKISAKVIARDAGSFDLQIFYDGRLRETHPGLTVVAGDPNNIETVLGSLVTPTGYLTTPGIKGNLVSARIIGYGAGNTSRKIPAATVSPTALTSGASGLKPTSVEIVGANTAGVRTGLQVFRNLEESDINLICVPGESTDAVLQELISIATSRGDCLAILDPPVASSVDDVFAMQDVEDTGRAFMNSSYAALYYPWIKTRDTTGKELLLPPSGFVASQMAYNDRNAFAWSAPAGFNRGMLTSATGVEYNASQEERDKLYSLSSAVNPIVAIRSQGVMIYGQKTLYRDERNSTLDRINVRRLALYLRRRIATVSRSLLFEPNDQRTWDSFKMLVAPILDNVQANRGISYYQIKMDSETVTPEHIANNQLPGIIIFKPVEAAEVITLDFTLLPSGVEFPA